MRPQGAALLCGGQGKGATPEDELSGVKSRELLLGKSRQLFNQPAKIAGGQQQHGIVLAQLRANSGKALLAGMDGRGLHAGCAHALHDLMETRLLMGRSPLVRRLGMIQAQIHAMLDEAPPGPLRAVSLCAGQGRDLIGVLASHPRALT